MTSGAWSELSTWLAVCRICSKPFSSNFTVTPGCELSKSLMAWFQAMPIALLGPS
jgi:hypothetical protein